MGSFSIWHWLVVGLLVMLLFGRGRISDLMGDVAKGIKSFKRGMAEDETPATTPTGRLDVQPPATTTLVAPSPVIERHPEPRT